MKRSELKTLDPSTVTKGTLSPMYFRILKAIEPRLKQIGEIKTREVWKITNVNYFTAAIEFRRIMSIMVIQGKAVKIKNGTWNIIKPDTK